VDVALGGRNFLNFMELSAGVLGQDSITQSSTDAGENNNGRDMNHEFQGSRPNAMLWTLSLSWLTSLDYAIGGTLT
jgi:hypothetical protein